MEDKEMLDRVEKRAIQDAKGREIPDPQPVAIPAGFRRPESLMDQIRRLTRNDLRLMMGSDEAETFEESEDFDIDDDSFDPSSPYEEVFDPVLGRGITLEEFRQNHAVYEERFLKAEEEAYKVYERSEALRARPKAAPAPSSEGPKKKVDKEE